MIVTNRDKITAIHEAGHALALYLHRRKFKYVEIVPGCGGGCVEDYQKPIPAITSDRMIRSIQKDIIISLAGMVAEGIIFGDCEDEHAETDLEHVSNWEHRIYESSRDFQAIRAAEWQETEKLLDTTRHKEAIQSIAESLLVNIRLDYIDVVKIIRDIYHNRDPRE